MSTIIDNSKIPIINKFQPAPDPLKIQEKFLDCFNWYTIIKSDGDGNKTIVYVMFTGQICFYRD